jgi:hypothetical protein
LPLTLQLHHFVQHALLHPWPILIPLGVPAVFVNSIVVGFW